MARYLWTFIGLILLTTLTFGLSYADLGPWGTPVAMLIAIAKATLVALYFMHLVEQQTSSRLTFLISVALLAVFIGLGALDVLSRATDLVPPAG